MADAIEVVNAMVLSDRNHKILLPDNLKAANEYITNGRTADFTAAMVGFLAARTKLVDYREYLANVRQLFYHLPENQTLDGATSWPRCLETHFGAHEKLKKDYLNQLARPKREKNSLPKTDTDGTTKTDEKTAPATTHKQYVREIISADFPLAKLEYIVRNLTAEMKRKRREASAPVTKPSQDELTKIALEKYWDKEAKKKVTHVFGSQNHDGDSANLIHGICGKYGTDPALFLPRDSKPKEVTCSKCREWLEKQPLLRGPAPVKKQKPDRPKIEFTDNDDGFSKKVATDAVWAAVPLEKKPAVTQ